jgi:hypothetical protein
VNGLMLALLAVGVVGSGACGSDSGSAADAAIADGAAGGDVSAALDTAPANDVAASEVASGDVAGPDAAPNDDGAMADTGADVTSTVDGGAAACATVTAMGCNTLANDATNVTLVVVATPIPVGTGGAIADGLYHLTEFKGYATTPLVAGVMLRQTLAMCNGVGVFVSEEKGGTYHKNFAVAPTGIMPNVTQTCSTQMPNVDIPYSSYTATPTTLTFYSSQYVFSGTYTKQ